jgi:xanthine dehydrogenase accessory factor
MAVRDDGAFVGSVSGGCVEGAVIAEAQAALNDNSARNLTFGVSDEQAWSVGLACGGTVRIHVTPLNAQAQREALAGLQSAREAGTAMILTSHLASGDLSLLKPFQGSPNPLLAEAAAKASLRDQSVSLEADNEEWFLSVYNPPLDLMIIGAVHIAQPLSAMARLADYTVRVIDPRTGFATAERFPGIALVHAWPDEAFAAQPPGRRTAVVALTHDPKLDDLGLIAALRSPAYYIGALGSKKTHGRRLDRLAQEGFSPDQLARIHGPIGLDIGARSPAEIAVAILAEMILALRQEQKNGQ